jgi:predicted Fe-Mo cluster-binding NifX family protein
MRQHGVTAVISGRYGPKAFQALQALNIAPWMAPYGLTARRALELFGEGKLQLMVMKVFR